ncbi:MAG: hypothetical protein AAFZ07_29760, partial [Actinomycetota bacterium]
DANERTAEAHGEALKGWARLVLARGATGDAASLAERSLEVLETVFAPTHASVEEIRALLEEINSGG